MSLPARFADLKKTIATSYPNFEENVTKAWAEILLELDKVTKTIKAEGVDVSTSISIVLYHSINQPYSRSIYLRSISLTCID